MAQKTCLTFIKIRPTNIHARFKHIIKRLKISGGFFLLVALFVLIVCWNRIVITTPPGHGGVVDRIDGLIFVLPVTYYLVNILNIG